MAAESSSSSLSARSNLERFLHCITPSLPSKTLPQVLNNHESLQLFYIGSRPSYTITVVPDAWNMLCFGCHEKSKVVFGLAASFLLTHILGSTSPYWCCLQDLNSEWQPPDKDSLEYFTLGELWDCYEEWSAYGIGIPLQLNNGDKIMQYFVPYLSAIQIYTTKSLATSRERKEDIDIDDYECDSWSDDTGSENLSRSLSNNSSRTWDGVSEDSTAEQEGLWAGRNKLGHLYLQYFEQSSPYWRMPITDKINELTRVYPSLMTLRSVDLSPASWMSVSWYPIYHIPRQKNEKDFATCFLTYHTLSSSFQDSEEDYARADGKRSTDDDDKEEEEDDGEAKSGGIVLPSFGLVSHKMQADVWIKPGSGDQEKSQLLHSAADSWLKQLAVHHHDFNFFTSHSTVS